MSANFLTPKNWDSATDVGRNNLVFQNRNHSYGAFVIRRDYNHHLFLALFISIGIFLSAFIIPKILLSSSGVAEIIVPSTPQITIPVTITPPIQKLEDVVMPPPVIEKRKVATQNNVTLIVKDDKVDPTLLPNIQIVNPGTITTPGDVDLPIIDQPFIDDGIGKEVPPPPVVLSAEVMPEFPGGQPALFKYLQNNINYPYGAKENGIKGTVYVGFVIDVTGKPVMLTILKGIRGGKDLEAEALRVIGNMPYWSPGLQNNKPVSVQFSLPVKFDLR